MIERTKTANIKVDVPFEFCGTCPDLEPERITFVGNKVIYAVEYECAHRNICARAVSGYKRMLEERRHLPYDAMGDDEGRG